LQKFYRLPEPLLGCEHHGQKVQSVDMIGVFPHGLPKAILGILKIAPLMMQQSFAKLMHRQVSGPSMQLRRCYP